MLSVDLCALSLSKGTRSARICALNRLPKGTRSARICALNLSKGTP
jgi:hypothetical protein